MLGLFLRIIPVRHVLYVERYIKMEDYTEDYIR